MTGDIPAEIGYTADSRGVFRAPITDAKRAQLSALRRQDADADSAHAGTPQAAEPAPAVGRDTTGPVHTRTGGAVKQVRTIDGRAEMWLPFPLPGGWVCAEPDDEQPDGMCAMPVEDEPCPIHHPHAQEALG